ncbi:unnamed protein product [Rotaria sp. Silwood1]|nr:unnamed protein product [Rotaria sp. Silwood1]
MFSEQQLKVLEKGLKYVPTPKSIDLVDIITNVETSLNSIPKIVKQTAISEITEFIQKWRTPKCRNLTKIEEKLLKELRSIKDIVIVPADKGGRIVILNKDDYIFKIEQKLKDTKIYTEVTDPTNNIKSALSNFTQKLFQQQKITQGQQKYLTSIENIPTVRGQPKLHKIDKSMRLITCSRDTIISPISQLAFSLIKELRKTIKSNIINTKNFVEIISKIKLDSNDNLASLDISDMFNNVPVTRAIDIAIYRIEQSTAFNNSLFTKSDVKQMILISLNNSFIRFNGKFYRQKSGLPMGNCLSPLLADLYMDDYIEKYLTDLNQTNKLWRYVDDILILTKMNKDELDTYVKKINKRRSNIKFTMEYENDKTINFLDTSLRRNENDNSIDIRWFRKESAADRLLNYNSCHHKSIKRNIVTNMTSRIITTSKHTYHQQQDLQTLKKMLKNSDYPKKEVNKLIEQTIRSINQPLNVQVKNKKEYLYSVVIPYVPGVEILKRRLEKLKIRVFFSYKNKIKSFFNSCIKQENKSVIYQLECECNNIYNGETKVGIWKRMKQHENEILKDKEESKSEIVQHFHSERFQCMFHPEEAFIIDTETNWFKRRTKEAIYSIINESINRHNDIDSAWLHILLKNKEQIKKRIAFKKSKRFETSARQDGNSGTDDEEENG